MQLLSKAISAILTADTEITDITGSGNIWHAKIPQRNTDGTDEPVAISILFYVYAITPNDTKSGASEVDEVMVRVHVVGGDDEQLSNVARYVRLSLDRIEPGYYQDIEIQGSRFLNAYYEPDGAYQLEQQEWVLEFQFRVIDNEIRGNGTNMAVTILKEKTNVLWSDLASPYSAFTLPAGAIIHWVIIEAETVFSGGVISACQLTVGKESSTALYHSGADVFSATNIRSIKSNTATFDGDEPTPIYIVAVPTGGTVSDLEAGEANIWIYYSIPT